MKAKKKNRFTMPYGPASDFVVKTMSEFKFYKDYVSGSISRDSYIKAFQKNSKEVSSRLLNDEHLYFLAREYQPDLDKHALRIFSELVKRGFLREIDESIKSYYLRFKNKVTRRYKHGRHHTFIQPDEAHLLYLISASKMPLSMIAIGAYYGYWAVWAMPGIKAVGGKALLIDPNPAVCRLAKTNFEKMRYSHFINVAASKAEDVIPNVVEPADLVLLDASGAHDSRNHAYRGKGIYSFLIESIWQKMTDGGFLVVHNDKPSKGKGDVLKGFHEFCADHFHHSFYAPTPEGIGIYIK